MIVVVVECLEGLGSLALLVRIPFLLHLMYQPLMKATSVASSVKTNVVEEGQEGLSTGQEVEEE